MSAPPDIVDPAEALLAELAGLDMSLARHVHACAMATEDPNEVANLVRAYQRVSRSARQSLALQARLKRERERAQRENPPPPPPRDEARIRRRVAELRPAVQRVIWSEYERAEVEDEDFAEYFYDLLEKRLERHARDDAFGLEPLNDHVVALCLDLDLPTDLARTWRELSDPPSAYDDGAGKPDLQSSA